MKHHYWTFRADQVLSSETLETKDLESKRDIFFQKFKEDDEFEFLIFPETLGPITVFSDMDGTLVTEETLVELANYLKVRNEIELITDSAMRGELDFEASLRQRVKILKGIPETVVQDFAHKVTFTEGARELFNLFGEHCIDSYLLTGGFHEAAEYVKKELRLKSSLSNQFEYLNNALSGLVMDPVVDATAKAEYLLNIMNTRPPTSTSIAFGDGANDLPLFKAADIAIGLNPKDVLRPHLNGAIRSFNNLKKIFLELKLQA